MKQGATRKVHSLKGLTNDIKALKLERVQKKIKSRKKRKNKKVDENRGKDLCDISEKLFTLTKNINNTFFPKIDNCSCYVLILNAKSNQWIINNIPGGFEKKNKEKTVNFIINERRLVLKRSNINLETNDIVFQTIDLLKLLTKNEDINKCFEHKMRFCEHKNKGCKCKTTYVLQSKKLTFSEKWEYEIFFMFANNIYYMQRFQSVNIWKFLEDIDGVTDKKKFMRIKHIFNVVFPKLYCEFYKAENKVKKMKKRMSDIQKHNKKSKTKIEITKMEKRKYNAQKKKLRDMRPKNTVSFEINKLFVLGEKSFVEVNKYVQTLLRLFEPAVSRITRYHTKPNILKSLLADKVYNVTNSVFHIDIPTEFCENLYILQNNAVSLDCVKSSVIQQEKFLALQIKLEKIKKVITLNELCQIKQDICDNLEGIYSTIKNEHFEETFWYDIQKICLKKNIREMLSNSKLNEDVVLTFKKISLSIHQQGYISITGFKDVFSIRVIFPYIMKFIYSIVPQKEKFLWYFTSDVLIEGVRSKKKMEKKWKIDEKELKSVLFSSNDKIQFRKSNIKPSKTCSDEILTKLYYPNLSPSGNSRNDLGLYNLNAIKGYYLIDNDVEKVSSQINNLLNLL